MFSFSFVFSIGVYDRNGNYLYYVSNSNPQINLSIESPNEPVILESVNLNVNTIDNFKLLDGFLGVGENLEYSFLSSVDFGISNLTSSDEIFFSLNAKGFDDKKITPKGDPTEFEIIVDKEEPKIYSPVEDSNININTNDNLISFRFNENLLSYRILLNGNVVQEYRNPSSFQEDFFNNFDYRVDLSKLAEGENTISIEYFDLAQNKGSSSFGISFRDSDLSVTLVTKKEDSSLNYFFDKNFREFFANTIYVADEDYTLTIRTSKVSTCYFSNSLLSFREIYDVAQKTKMDSSNGLTHTSQMNTLNSKIWVACENPVYPDDVVYLSKEMNIPGLINVKRYTGESVSIENILPSTLVSSNLFDVYVNTNVPAVCKYSLNGNDIYLSSNDFLNHNKFDLNLNDGSYNFNFECFDVLYNKDSQSRTIKVDSLNGVKVVDFDPKYTNLQTTSVKISFSEESICKFSSKQESSSNFDSLSELTGSGLQKSFEASGLSIGDNKFYIYCEKEGEIWSSNINVVYDSAGPQLSNLTFVNNGIESDYVAGYSQIGFNFNVVSLTPIDKYYATVFMENGSETFIFSSNRDSIIGNFQGASKISVRAQSIIGVNSSTLEKVIKFDLTEPVINFNSLGDRISISCFDLESGCNLIRYGLAKTAIECEPILTYDLNSSVETQDYNYICALGRDGVGNEVTAQKVILFDFEKPEENLTDSFENVTFETDSQEEIDPFVPSSFKPETSGSGGLGFGIIAALVIVFASLGGGSYYAYRKGYLDEQLKKFGIVKGSSNSSNSSSSNNNSSNNSKSSLFNRKNKSGSNEKDSYEHNYNKLNQFIDSTLKKGNDIFDKFEGGSKGKVKEYEDSHMSEKKGEISGKDMDEFYKKSKELEDVSKKSNSTDKDAEDFEKYYKDKKGKDNKKK
jgi:hypothetical protein